MSATVLTPLADTDPSVAAANLDAVGVVGTVSNFNSALANGHIDVAGLVPGVAFSIAISAPSGTVAAPTFAVTESSGGYDITVTPKSTTGTGNGTTSAMIAALNADAVAGKIVQATLHTGSDGTGVINAAVTKASSTGQTSPDVVNLGTEQASLDVTNGNTFTNTGGERLLIDNADSGTSQVTITSTDTLTVKTFEIDHGKFVSVVLPLAVWGAAPVVTGVDTGIKLSVIAAPTTAEIETLAGATGSTAIAIAEAMSDPNFQTAAKVFLPGQTPTTSLQNVTDILVALRDDAGATGPEKRAYRRLIHEAAKCARRVTGVDYRLANDHHDNRQDGGIA